MMLIQKETHTFDEVREFRLLKRKKRKKSNKKHLQIVLRYIHNKS